MLLAFLVSGSQAHAGDCPGNPDAIGTSRTLVVDPLDHPRIGTMQYHETLPLQDHEVVLTFDDGPLPKHSKPVLDILAANCVKATFFTVGSMAQEFPAALREVRDAGHSIGTHTQNHILKMDRMPLDEAKAEIDNGIASAAAALGGEDQVAPFFRIPGLLRSEPVEEYLASKGLMTWSADFPADDWHHISSASVVEKALRRLELHGRGILLLHDIQARTQAALPIILREMKARGYRIVHVIPATRDVPKTPTQPWQWQLHPSDPALIVMGPDGSRFAFDAASHSLTTAGLRNAPVNIPTHTLARGEVVPIWNTTGAVRIDDAAVRLLGPPPKYFEFGEKSQSRFGAKAAASAQE